MDSNHDGIGDACSGTCGNGVVEAGEQCDSQSPCCAACQFAAAATSCSDGNACNGAEACDGAGACMPAAALDCNDNNTATNDTCIAATGCAHLTTTGAQDTTVQGNTAGGTLYVDTCPAGQIMVGFNASIGASFDQIQVVCGVPSLAADLATTIAAGDTLTLRGATVNTPASSACPAAQVIVGFDGRAGALIDQLALRCAPMTATYGTGAYTVMLGTPAAVTPVGGTGGTQFSTTDCPAGQIAIGANIRAGGSVDGFGLICGVPSVN